MTLNAFAAMFRHTLYNTYVRTHNKIYEWEVPIK